MTSFILEREFSADPDTVFSFVTENENLLKWWGPEGMYSEGAKLDLSKIGAWGSVMINADGKRFKVTGEVISVDPPNAVEFTWGWHDENDDRGHDSTVRFELLSNGKGGTLFKLTHSNLPDDESVVNHGKGWTSSLVKLERLAA